MVDPPLPASSLTDMYHRRHHPGDQTADAAQPEPQKEIMEEEEGTFSKAVVTFSPPGFATFDRAGRPSRPLRSARRCAELLHRPDRGHIKSEDRMVLRNLLRLFAALCFYAEMKGAGDFWSRVAGAWELPGQDVTHAEARKIARFFTAARSEYLKRVAEMPSAGLEPAKFTTTGLQLVQAVDFWARHRKLDLGPRPTRREAKIAWERCEGKFAAVNKNSMYTLGAWFTETLQKFSSDLHSAAAAAAATNAKESALVEAAQTESLGDINDQAEDDADVVFVRSCPIENNLDTDKAAAEGGGEKKKKRKRERKRDHEKKKNKDNHKERPEEDKVGEPKRKKCMTTQTRQENGRERETKSRHGGDGVQRIAPSSGTDSGPFVRGAVPSSATISSTPLKELSTPISSPCPPPRNNHLAQRIIRFYDPEDQNTQKNSVLGASRPGTTNFGPPPTNIRRERGNASLEPQRVFGENGQLIGRLEFVKAPSGPRNSAAAPSPTVQRSLPTPTTMQQPSFASNRPGPQGGASSSRSYGHPAQHSRSFGRNRGQPQWRRDQGGRRLPLPWNRRPGAGI